MSNLTPFFFKISTSKALNSILTWHLILITSLGRQTRRRWKFKSLYFPTRFPAKTGSVQLEHFTFLFSQNHMKIWMDESHQNVTYSHVQYKKNTTWFHGFVLNIKLCDIKHFHITMGCCTEFYRTQSFENLLF